MRFRRLVLPIAAALGASATPAHAADLTSVGSDVRFAGPADSGRALAVFIRAVQSPGAPASLDVLARRVGRDGRPLGRKVLLGQDAAPGPALVGEAVAVAYDSRRRSWLVAWSGREAGMAVVNCGPAPSGPISGPPCRQAKREIFVRRVDRTGRAAGPARRITATGSAQDAFAVGAVPALAYDRRADRFLLLSVASIPREGSTLAAQPLRPDGTPAAAARTLAVGAGTRSSASETRVVAAPRGGFLLAYTAGGEQFDVRDRELYTQAMSAAGDPEGGPTQISKPGRPGASGLRIAVNDRDVLALWSESGSGASKGWRARRLTRDGRPRGGTTLLPFTVGTGPVDVAAFGSGWLYGYTEERPEGGHAALVRRGRSGGRPVGGSRVVSDDDAVSPSVTDAGQGAALVGWTYSPVTRGSADPPPPARPRVGTTRP